VPHDQQEYWVVLTSAGEAVTAFDIPRVVRSLMYGEMYQPDLDPRDGSTRWGRALVALEAAGVDLAAHGYTPQAPVVRGETSPATSATSDASEHAVPPPQVAQTEQIEIECEVAAFLGAPEIARNTALETAAYTLGSLVADGALDETAVRVALLDAATSTGLPREEADRMISSGLAAGANAPRDLSEQSIVDWHEELKRAANAHDESAQKIPRDADRDGVAEVVPLEAAKESRRKRRARDGGETTRERKRKTDEAEAAPSAPNIEDTDSRPVVALSNNMELMRLRCTLTLADNQAMYQRGGELVRIVLDEEEPEQAGWKVAKNMPRAKPHTRASLDCEVSRVLNIFDVHAKHPRPVPIPSRLLDAILGYGAWHGVRRLAGIADQPVLRPDGTVLAQPGYDAATGLYFCPSGDVVQVPEHPTLEDAIAARKALEHVVTDFPFVERHHLSAWLASTLTIAARYAFVGPTPLMMFDAATRGTGKTLLAQIAARIATGRDHVGCSFVLRSGEEQEKRLTAAAQAAFRTILHDNAIDSLTGEKLCEVLTSTTYSGRILGTSRIWTGPWSAVLFVTGNNIQFAIDDLVRRTLYCRLESTLENPEDRTDFVHPNLEAWVAAEQPRLLAAVLTIACAYATAGRPPVELTPWGSYDAWSAAVRAPLVWCGAVDPGKGLAELRTAASSATESQSALVHGWARLVTLNGGPLTAAKALERLYPELGGDPHPELRSAIEDLWGQPKRISSRSLGKMLARNRGRVFEGKALRVAFELDRYKHWTADDPKSAKPQDDDFVDEQRGE
jgi:hypothetical protein